MAKIVTFGELMLRLSPVGYNRLFQTESLEGSFGGGEQNDGSFAGPDGG